MEEAPENGKESSHSAHANGMNITSVIGSCPKGSFIQYEKQAYNKQKFNNLCSRPVHKIDKHYLPYFPAYKTHFFP
jgi:hypothetical protein